MAGKFGGSFHSIVLCRKSFGWFQLYKMERVLQNPRSPASIAVITDLVAMVESDQKGTFLLDSCWFARRVWPGTTSETGSWKLKLETFENPSKNCDDLYFCTVW